MHSPTKSRTFFTLFATVVVADLGSKLLAERMLVPRYVPHDVLGSALRFTLAYNPGAAFGFDLGGYSRFVFSALTLAALVALAAMYRATPASDRRRVVALALVCAGAVGNLIDRIRSPQGVVDFIDLGLGDARFWTFNVADMSVTFGALLLAWVLWFDERPSVAMA